MYNLKDDVLDSLLHGAKDLFVEEDRPTIVEATDDKGQRVFPTIEGLGGYVKYHARKLTPLGKKTGDSIGDDCMELARRKFGYNPDTRKCDTRWNRAIVSVLFEQVYPVVQAEESQRWTVEGALAVYQLDNEYFQKCYDAAVAKNPWMDAKRAAALEAAQGKAQEGTHDEATGKPKTPEETAPLG